MVDLLQRRDHHYRWKKRAQYICESHCLMNISSPAAGHRDHQHGHPDGAHRGHPRQNGLHRNERSRHRRLGLRSVQVIQRRHPQGKRY